MGLATLEHASQSADGLNHSPSDTPSSSIPLAILRHTGALTGQAAVAFIGGWLKMMLGGVVVAGICLLIGGVGSGGSRIAAGAAAVVALALVAVVAIPLSIKTAVACVAARAATRFRLSSIILRIAFDRLLGVNDDTAAGERGSRVAQAIEQMPAAQARTALHDAIAAIEREMAPADSWFIRRWVIGTARHRLLKEIERLAGAYLVLEASHSPAGTVDLVKLRDKLAEVADRELTERIDSAARRARRIALLLCGVVACLMAWGLRSLPLLWPCSSPIS